MSKEKVESTVAEFEAESLSAFGHVADVSASDGERSGAATLERFGDLQVVVNNVGILRDDLITKMPAEDWDLVLRVNLKSYFLVTKAAVSHMIEQRHGRM